MSFKNVLWPVPLTEFQEFDHGAVISDTVPASWGLQVGDRLQYEAGCNIAGMATVVSVGQEQIEIFDWDAACCEIEAPPTIAGVRCTFKKLN